MSQRTYDWSNNPVLGEHSKCKHRIQRDYFREYLKERCKIPHSHPLRLAIVDGFSGAGRYSEGEPGSPIIFTETLLETTREINSERVAMNMPKLEVDCLLILNDEDPGVIDLLRENMAPFVMMSKEEDSSVHLKPRYHSDKFENLVEDFIKEINGNGYTNTIYNLDQYGWSGISSTAIYKLLNSTNSAEVFFTFSIQAFLTFLPLQNKEYLKRIFEPRGISLEDLDKPSEEVLSKKEWLGGAERLVYNIFKESPFYFSPFAIHNPNGWKYWLLHFTKNYRGRQIYNDILHRNSSSLAHYGRSGLNMLRYDPEQEGQLYLFDSESRKSALSHLYDDIPNFLEKKGGLLRVEDFYEGIYNETPAHSHDINKVIFESSDLEVKTKMGNERRKAHTITKDDTIQLTKQLILPGLKRNDASV